MIFAGNNISNSNKIIKIYLKDKINVIKNY